MNSFLKHVVFFALSTLFLSACTSLPKGADDPELTIHSVRLNHTPNAQKQPTFLIEYTLKHHSPTDLESLALHAEVALGHEVSARFDQEAPLLFKPNDNEHHLLEVPITLLGSASMDSLRYNPHLILDISAQMHIVFTEVEELQHFNPSSRFSSLIAVHP